MKFLSVLENLELAQTEEGGDPMLSVEQLYTLRTKSMNTVSQQLRSKESELSTKQLVDLLRLALKHLRSQDQLFEMFDEVLSERVSSSGMSNEEFSAILEVVADHNQSCPQG